MEKVGDDRKLGMFYNSVLARHKMRKRSYIAILGAIFLSRYENVVNLAPRCDTVIVSGADYEDCNGEYKGGGIEI